MFVNAFKMDDLTSDGKIDPEKLLKILNYVVTQIYKIDEAANRALKEARGEVILD